MPDRLEVGRISRAHGIRGEVLVVLVTNRVERVAPGAVLHAGARELAVLASRPHQNGWIVAFDGVLDRSAAEALRGVVVAAEPLDDPDELWVHELVGATVVEVGGADRGRVASVLANPASDLLVLDSGALVPLAFVVDRTEDRIVIDPPEGLFDL